VPDQPNDDAGKQDGGAKGTRKRGAAGAEQLAARLAGLAGATTPDTTAARAPRAARGQAPGGTAKTTAPARTGRPSSASTRRGTKAVTTAAPMSAEQAKPTVFYSARVSHSTTPEQLGALERIRLEENTARRAARRPAISITALLRAATEICLENDRLRAQMIKRAGEEWN
jgi:hypothetical protein